MYTQPKLPRFAALVLLGACSVQLPIDSGSESDGTGTTASTDPTGTSGGAEVCPACKDADDACSANSSCAAARDQDLTEPEICEEFGNTPATAEGFQAYADLVNCIAQVCDGKADPCHDLRIVCESTGACPVVSACWKTCKCAGVDEMGVGVIDKDLQAKCMDDCNNMFSGDALASWKAYAQCLFNGA